MKPQFEIPDNCTMPRVVIAGNYFGDKCFPDVNNLHAAYGRSPQIGNSMKQKFQRICLNEIRDQIGGLKIEKPVILHYRYFEPEKGQKRDRPNIHGFTTKVFCDALTEHRGAGVIKDDSPKYLLNETHDFFYVPYGEEPRIEVYIEEVDDA